jgi:hypothetical protein
MQPLLHPGKFQANPDRATRIVLGPANRRAKTAQLLDHESEFTDRSAIRDGSADTESAVAGRDSCCRWTGPVQRYARGLSVRGNTVTVTTL